MRKSGIIFFVCFIFIMMQNSFSQELNIDSALAKLDETLNNKNKIESEKLQLINSLKLKLQQLPVTDLQSRYNITENLFEEYKSFFYDSAFQYALDLSKLANQMRDEQKILAVKLKMGFIFLSSGLFKEAIDTLLSCNIEKLEKTRHFEYYYNLARAYLDLGDYNGSPFFYSIYDKVGIFYLQKSQDESPSNSLEYYDQKGTELIRKKQLNDALQSYKLLYDSYKMSEHKRAMVANSIGDIYYRLKQKDKALYFYAIASISDIKSTTRETVALRNLANLLYEQGKNERAHRYIKIALEDAEFYNARHRKKEVGNILPMIENEQLQNSENQNRTLKFYLLIISFLSVFTLIFLIISLIQFFKLKKTKELLSTTNSTLTETNNKLSDSNRIKEKYIGYYFKLNTNYLERIEKVQKSIIRKIASKQIDDLQEFIKKDLDPEIEREELNKNFDKIVLSLFPNFVSEFNKFLKPDEQYVLKENQLLNKELRIFALIRMGITDNDLLAKILNCSVNTIYTYKTKVKTRSLIPNNEFEDYVMKIDA